MTPTISREILEFQQNVENIMRANCDDTGIMLNSF